ncbi:MAG: hypothetical protein N3F63_02520 [Thermoplasmata archaeon]|nr:hypothetical protein [Thermoplasmata archaeon]
MRAKNWYSRVLCIAVMLMLLLPGVNMFIKQAGARAEIVQDEYGNLVINGTSVFEINGLTIDPLTGQTGKYGMKGNITVQNGGTLIIRDAELYFLQDLYHHYWLSVRNGGKIIMENATLTVGTNQILPYVFFNISMTNAGNSYINNSKIAYPGYFNVSGTNLSIINSNLSAITPPSQYQQPEEIDAVDDAPVLRAVNSCVVLINSSIDKCYENAYASVVYELKPLYRGAMDNTTNTNTAPLNSTDGNYYIVGAGQMMHIRNFDILGNTGNVLNAWLNITYRTDADYLSPTVMQISFDGGATWKDTTVAPNNRSSMVTETYTIGATAFGNLSNLQIRYQNLNDSLNLYIDKITVYAQVYIGVNERDQYDIIFEHTTVIAIDTYFDVDFLSCNNPEDPKANSNPQHNRVNLKSSSFGYFVNLTVNECQSPGHEDTPIITDATSELYLYRWLDVIVKDIQNMSVSGATIKVAYNGPSGEIAERVEKLNNLSTAPHGPYVLAALGRTLANYNVTNESGFCSIPLITDNISAAFWPNSMPYGNYLISLTYGGTGGPINLNSNMSYPAFPNINATANRMSLNFTLPGLLPDLTVGIPGMPSLISGGSPVSITVVVNNTGSAMAANAEIVLYDVVGDNITLIGKKSITVGPNTYWNNVSFTWSPNVPEMHRILAIADPLNNITEISKLNNQVSVDVLVYRPGIDLMIMNTTRTLRNMYYLCSGFVYLDNGTLILENTTFKVIQTKDNQFNVYMKGNSKLVLNKSLLTSDYRYGIIVADNGQIYGNNSGIKNGSLSGMAGVVYLRGTNYNGSISGFQCGAITFIDVTFVSGTLDYHGRVYAENTTFDRNLVFNGTDNVTLVAVTLPSAPDSVLAYDNAVVYIYRYLDVRIMDVNGVGVDNVNISVYDINMNLAAHATTTNGTARITLVTDIIDATTQYYSHFVGVYIVHISFGSGYWYNITMPSYFSWEKGIEITESISAIPDIAVSFATAFPSLLPYGATLNGTIQVENTGTGRAENVLLEIYDGLETVFSQRGTVLAGQVLLINFTYTANITGHRTLVLVADPGSELVETSKENNMATMEFIVYKPSSLLVVENTTVEISNTTVYQYGSVLIGTNGTLILDNATMCFSQPTAYSYGIYIYSNGNLVMKHSNIQSNYPYYLISIESGSTVATDSRITSASVFGMQNCSYTLLGTTFVDARVNITASRFTMIGGSLTEGFWQSLSVSAVALYLQDIYYPSQLILSPTSYAVLVNVSLGGSVGDIVTPDGAEVRIYRYLDVLTLDGNRNPLDSVNITVRFASNDTVAGNLLSDLYGNARFVLLTDIINYSIQSIGGTSFFVGNYRVVAEFAGENLTAGISFQPYPSIANVIYLNLTYTTQVPDFAVNPGDIKTPSAFDYYTGALVNITVRNIGPRNGVNVTIVVYDMNLDANTVTEINRTVINILSGSVVSFTVQWLPSMSGNHSIKVEIDPASIFNETSKANNIAVSQSVWFNPSIKIVTLNISKDALPYDESVYINLTVKNTGNVNMSNFEVVLEDTYIHQSIREFINVLNAGQSVNISFSYPVATPGNHTVNLRIELDRVYDAETFVLKVYSPPDLEVTSSGIRVLFGTTPVSKAMEETPLAINVTVTNLANTPAYNVTVEIYNDTYLITSVLIPVVDSLSSAEISVPWNASMPGRIVVSVLKCEQPYPEKNTANNNAEKQIEVIPLPDLKILDFYAEKNGNKTVNFTAGDTAILWLNISNSVDYPVENFSVEVFAGNISEENLIASVNLTINASEMHLMNFTWAVHLEANTTLHAVLNRNHTITEKNYTNNVFDLNLTIISAKLLISFAQLPLKFNIDDIPVVSGQILREATGEGIPGINVSAALFLNDKVVYQQTVVTDENGNFTVTLMQLKEPGQYRVVLSCPDYPDVEAAISLFNVEKPVPPPQFPWLMVIIAVIAVVGISLAVVFLYFRRAAGKLVECGECGAYIPENATKCPKCGTEFEVTTVKCSECGAWIDGKATVCPECGTVFTGKKVEAESYEEMMRREFNAYVEKFKTEAKKELGKEYSESAFWAWWKNKPTYRTYTQWLKEEELKKRGALKCPQCTTLNEKTSKVCLKCGTSLEGAELVQTEKLPGVKGAEVLKEETKPEPEPPEVKKPPVQNPEEAKKSVQPMPPVHGAPPVKTAEDQKQPPQSPQVAPKPQVPLPPKPAAPKEEMPTLPIRGGPPATEQPPPEKALLEFKPEPTTPGAPKVVVIRKPTAAKVVIPKKVVRKPMTPGQEGEGQETQDEETQDKQQL